MWNLVIKLQTENGYTSNAAEEQKQPASLQIFHLGGQRKEKHNNHIMAGSIMNRRAAIFFHQHQAQRR